MQTADRSLAVEHNSTQSEPHCPQCDYNLTALTSQHCPECGWKVDWTKVYSEEALRAGTPTYHARGWRRIPAAFHTTALMLFRPVRFARQLRWDEPLWPATVVAVCAYALTFLPIAISEVLKLRPARSLQVPGAYLAAIATCIAINAIGYLVLCARGQCGSRWRQRFRMILAVSMYSTIFVAAWPIAYPPTFELEYASFLWPFSRTPFAEQLANSRTLGNSVLFYWWLTVLVVFAGCRARPRWTAICFGFVVFASSYAATMVGSFLIPY